MKPIPTPQIVPLQPSQSPINSQSTKEKVNFSRSFDQVPNARSVSPTGKNPYDEFITKFIQSKNLAPKSAKAYQLDFSRFNQWSLLKGITYSEQFWQEITYQHLTRFQAYLKQELNLSNSTIRRTLSTLKQFFDWMIDNDLLNKNPARKLVLPEISQTITPSLSEEEIKWLFEAAALTTHPERNRAIVSLLLHGLKAEEICSLNIGDFTGATITIGKKRPQGISEVPLNRQTQDYLQQYLAWRQSHSEGDREAGQIPVSDSPLFISYSSRSFQKRLGYNGLYWLITKEMAAIARQLAAAAGKELSPISPQRITDIGKQLLGVRG